MRLNELSLLKARSSTKSVQAVALVLALVKRVAVV